jgi:hypothetical protein
MYGLVPPELCKAFACDASVQLVTDLFLLLALVMPSALALVHMAVSCLYGWYSTKLFFGVIAQ